LYALPVVIIKELGTDKSDKKDGNKQCQENKRETLHECRGSDSGWREMTAGKEKEKTEPQKDARSRNLGIEGTVIHW
jgi:hypothetical protein